MITVQQVTTNHEWNLFFTFPNKLYKGNPYYVPTLLLDERLNFNPHKNPAFEFTDSVAFLASDDGKVVGRIAALINNKLNEANQSNTMRFTRFDVIDDIEVSRMLFEKIFAWGKEQGMERVIGPIGFSDLDKQGLLIEGFDQVSMFITLYNHPYYQKHLEELGFTKEVDWVEYKIHVPTQVDARIERVSNLAQKRHGYRLLSFSHKKEVLPYAHKIFHMYNEAYADLYGFYSLNDRQVDLAIRQFLSLISLEYIFVVVDAANNVIGFGIMAPSLSKALQRNEGRLFPLGFMQILKAKRNHEIMDFYLIAVKPEYLGRGVNVIILHEGLKRAIANGVRYAETGPELETNIKVQSQWKSFTREQHKRRRCFIRPL